MVTDWEFLLHLCLYIKYHVGSSNRIGSGRLFMITYLRGNVITHIL